MAVTVRNDTGVQEGEVSIYYDPMIAKLVTHGPSRAAAIEAQSTALDSFYIDGIRHNVPFLSALMSHPRWREGKLSTGFIAEEFPRAGSRRAGRAPARRLAAVAAAIDHVLGERKRQISGQMIGRPVQRASRRAVWLEREEIPLEIVREADHLAIRFIDADGTRPAAPGGVILEAGRPGLAWHDRWRGSLHAGAAGSQRLPSYASGF